VAVRPGHADVGRNALIFRHVVALGATVEGRWGAAVLGGLGPAPREFVFMHGRIGAFHGARPGDVLTAPGARHLLVAGVATTVVVPATMGQAANLGYRVTVAADAGAAGLDAAALRVRAPVADVTTVAGALGAAEPFQV
ncbi:MAG: isochorismatase family protein, partial [Gemmobacter sp.]